MESLVALARICVSRNYPPETWIRLLQEATPLTSTSGDEQERYNLAIDSLLPLLLTPFLSKDADVPPGARAASDVAASSAFTAINPTVKTYLNACCSSSQPSKTHLIKSMVDRTVAGLDQDEDHLRNLAASLDGLANLLFQNTANPLPLVALFSEGDQRRSHYQRIVAVLRLLELSLAQQLVSLFTLAAYLLHTNAPALTDLRNCPDALINEVVRARAELSNLPPNSVLPVEAVVSAITSVSTLENLINAASGAQQVQSQAGDALSMLPTELTEMMADLIQSYAQRDEVVKRFATSCLRYHKNALRSRDRTGGDTRKEDLQSWLQAAIVVATRYILPSDHPKTRVEARWRAFVYGVLVYAVRDLSKRPDIGLAVEEWQQIMTDAFEQSTSLPKAQQNAANALKRLCLASDPQEKTMDEYLHQSPPAPEDLVVALTYVLYEYPAHAAAAKLVTEQISSWATASDLHSLHSFYHRIVLETPRIVDFLVLHTTPAALMAPLCQTLDSWGSAEDYGASQAMELFGGLLLALQTLTMRHPLTGRDGALSAGFCGALLSSPGSTAIAYPLASLSQENRKLVASWLSALFGNEGIDDDLIRSTHPHTLLALAATTVEQSLLAQEAGIIDEETLLGGLSYFSQDLLNYTLPGIIVYCRTRAKVPEKVVESLTNTDTTTRLVLDLVNQGVASTK